MALPFFNWSRTAASNATADATVNWQEGQLPSTVNDSARAMMASTAAFRDDIAGAIVTGGTSTNYTVSSYQVFDTLAHLNGQMIAFTPHATNGATVTLNVDGLGAKPLRSAPSVELPAGALILGTPYVVVYNNSDAVFYLHSGAGAASPYSVPLGGALLYWGATTPNSIFAFPAGQAISRTTYVTLFTLIGTTYGTGDGTATFNLPDVTGRVVAFKEASATRLTSTYFGGNSTTLGAVGGAESQTLTTPQVPSHTHTGTTGNNNQSLGHTHIIGTINDAAGGSAVPSSRPSNQASNTSGDLPHTHSFTSDATGGGSAHMNVQPTIICNQIMRII